MKSLDYFKFARLQGYLFSFIGLILGIIYGIGGFFVDLFVTLGWVTTNETPGLSIGTVYALGAIVIMPLIALGIGFLLGLVEAFCFNISLKWIQKIDASDITKGN